METEIGWGKTSLRWLFPLVTAMEKKGVGIIKTIENLSIRGAFIILSELSSGPLLYQDTEQTLLSCVWLEKHVQSLFLCSEHS